jgi:hypothetical protein
MVKMLKKLINKSDLTDDQIEELKTLLDNKNQ